MDVIRAQLSFDRAFCIEADGLSGGLALLWKGPFQLSLLSSSKFHIDVSVVGNGNLPWQWTGFYGKPTCHRHYDGWNMLRSLSCHVSMICSGW